MKVLGYFCEAEKKGSRSSLVGKTNKSCHTLHACSNIELVTVEKLAAFPPAAFEAVHAPVGNTHGTKRLAKPTQLQQHGARDPLKKMALQCCYDEDAS